MSDLQSIMDDLKSRGTDQYRKTYARHGIPPERTFGVSNAHLKAIAKTVRRRQQLALELYATGIMDAMYLAGIVADGRQMTRRQLQLWAEGSHAMPMIAEYTVPWVAVESADACHLATEWIASKRDHVASSGWCTYAGVVAITPDGELDLAEIERLLGVVEKKIDSAQGRARYTMNGFVAAVGSYVAPLLAEAKATSQRIGVVSVDMGDTACKVPVASASIARVEAVGKTGQKRKTIRC